MATADLTVIALGRPGASASEYIAEIHRRLAAQDDVRYVLHAIGTSLDGTTEDILRVVGDLVQQRSHGATLSAAPGAA